MATEEQFGPPPSSNEDGYRVEDDTVALQIAVPGSNGTYIVQMPKDQIYRVPPPENAAFVERLRQPPERAPRSARRCSPCACYTASALFFAAITAIVFFLIYKITLSPKNPLFVIQSLSVDGNHKSGRGRAHHAPPTYRVGIQATNPNAFNSLVYVAGTAELVSSGKGIGKGQSPAVSQQPKQIDEFEVALHGPGPAPSKRLLKLRLKMSLNIKKKSWLTDHTDLLLLVCDFVVDNKGSALVKSQTCAYL